ncbi:sporulation protein YqfC [Anaerosalibacter sp. Marseille-P3206]|uniref:sporulation protein YqfC n=1 Tax=Anaerosalibacter sp. Marseille-P3206 TaxID=1871005 RepID=UPI0009868D29|nr:sporulation protein YqfC [Anaerosalibacter sp. Marseille-P3206]
MKNRIDEFKSNISETFELPKDIIMDLPKISVIGNIQLIISNHKGIIEYSNEIIRINTNTGVVKITGNDMYLKTILTEEIIIAGTIEKIEFLY